MVPKPSLLIGTAIAAVFTPVLGSSVLGASANKPNAARDYRASVIARAQVWRPSNVSAVDFKTGPTGSDAFAPGDTVTCTYSKKKLTGKTPKFECLIDEHAPLKVKYGGDNGEVYAEVLSTRLLWALGFGADRMYSVRVVCRD